jgi:hypothetical protein
MGKKGVVLENHRDPVATKLHQLVWRVGENVFAVEVDLSLRGLDEPDQAAYQG